MVVDGRRVPKPKPKEKPPPTSRITKIASLKRYPDKDYANSILHDVAKEVAPLMHEYNFKVGLLCEMFPKDGNLLGLNVNSGSKIMLRLRFHSNERSFLPMGDIIGTMLHELTHNVHGAHDTKFYKLLDELKERYSSIPYNPVKGYVMEENKLGTKLGTTLGGLERLATTSMRDKRIKALTKKIKTETRKLGGTKSNDNVRILALEAAERRLKDSKWCNDNAKDSEPGTEELEIIEIDDFPKEQSRPEKTLKNGKSNSEDPPKNGQNKLIPEVIVID